MTREHPGRVFVVLVAWGFLCAIVLTIVVAALRCGHAPSFAREERGSLGASISTGKIAPGLSSLGNCGSSFDARAVSSLRPSLGVGSEGMALRSFSDVSVMEHAAMLFEAADLADAFRHIGSTCRTPAAIRARVRTGYMSPDDHTPRGGALWTADGVQRELLREARLIRYFGRDTSRRLQRWANREPVQLEMEEKA